MAGKNILIIGGSRFVGPHLIKILINHGHNLTVFNRGLIQSEYPKGVQFIRGDRNNKFNTKNRFDVVIDMCAFNGKQTENALRQLRFDFFLHFGTSAVYKKPNLFPLTELSPIGEWPIWGNYNKGKVECEKVLEKSGVKYASLRPGYILGPKNYCDREHFIYSQIKNNRQLVLPGNGQAKIQFVFAEEIAKIMVFLAENKLAGAFNCAGDEIITLENLVEEMAKIVQKKPTITCNQNADGENFNGLEFPFPNENFIISNKKIKELDIVFLPLFEGLKKDYESYYKYNI